MVVVEYAKVTIEGSRHNRSVVLAAGVRKTVALTPRVQGLIEKGFVVLVGEPQPAAAPPADHTGVTEDDPSGVTPLPTGDFAPVDDNADEESAAEGSDDG